MEGKKKAKEKKSPEPEGMRVHSAPDTASLLLDVAKATPASSLLVPMRNGHASRLELLLR